MGTVIIDRRGTRLGYDKGAMTVREPDAAPRNVPLHLLDRLVVAASVELESKLMTRLAERDAAVLVLPARGPQPASLLASVSHGDPARRLGQYRLCDDEAERLRWARRFVRAKLLGQLRTLRAVARRRPARRRTLSRGIGAVERRLADVAAAPAMDRLRGLEGAATARFFAAYRSGFADALGFRGRNRRPPRDPVNACLSLGYTLVHGDAAEAAARAGLDPMLGFLHAPAHNRAGLACDLVEIARHRVDALVYRLFADRRLSRERFRADGGGVRLDKTGRAAFFQAYEATAPAHRRWFRRYAQALARAANGAAPATEDTEGAR